MADRNPYTLWGLWGFLLIGMSLGGGFSACAATLTLHPGTPLVTPGTRLPLRIDARDAGGNTVSAGAVTWSITPGTGSATLSSDGILTGQVPGTVTVSAQTAAGSITTTGYVLESATNVILATPDVEAHAGETVSLPFILSTSPDITDVTFTVRLTSAMPGAPALSGFGYQDTGESVSDAGPTPEGYRIHFHWLSRVHGTVVTGSVAVEIPGDYAQDTVYQIEITGVSVQTADGQTVPVTAQSGTLTVRAAQPGPAAQLLIVPASATAKVGQSIRFTALATDVTGNRVTNAPIAWTTDILGFGSITPEGVFTAAAPGTAIIRATSGDLSGTAQITISGNPLSLPEVLVLPTVSARPGTTADVPVLLGEVKGLGGLTFRVSAAQEGGAPLAMLEPETGFLAAGTLLGSNPQPDGSQSVALLASRDLNGPGVLMTLRFQIPATASGSLHYPIHIEGLDISDGKGQTISGTAYTGEITLSVDTTPPVVTLSGVNAGDFVRGIVNLSAAASDDTGVSQVDLLVDGAVASSTTNAPYSLSWDTAQTPDGPHAVQLRATDASGNVGLSPPVTVTVDNTPPVVALLSPQPDAVVTGTVTVTGSVQDAAPGQIAAYRLEIGAGTTPTDWQLIADGTVPRSSEALGSVDAFGLAAGTYTLRLTATDRAGNAGVSQVSVTVNARMPGDVNGDGKVNVADATMALQAAVGLLTLTPDQSLAADVNGDHKVNVADATLILRQAVGLG